MIRVQEAPKQAPCSSLLRVIQEQEALQHFSTSALRNFASSVLQCFSILALRRFGASAHRTGALARDVVVVATITAPPAG
jgi:hypothetical protein